MLKTILPIPLIISCMSLDNSKLNPEKLYERDMTMRVYQDTKKVAEGNGTLVVPQRETQNIYGDIYKRTKVLKITTCHRQITIKEPGDKFKYVYSPIRGLEDGYCPMSIGAFDEHGQHSWGFIDFVNDENLIGWVGCNGKEYSSVGVTICQSKSGLLQTIKFDEAVDAHTECDDPDTEDGLAYQYVMEPGKCVYLFHNPLNGELHRMSTIGYDEVMIRN